MGILGSMEDDKSTPQPCYAHITPTTGRSREEIKREEVKADIAYM